MSRELAVPTPQDVLKDLHERGALPDGYVYPASLEALEPALKALLLNVQKALSEDLRRVSSNVLFGVVPPPFHVDYVDATGANAENAIAFRSNGFSFILFTLPMVRRLLRTSDSLGGLPAIPDLLDMGPPDPALIAVLRDMLFSNQLNFLVSHEFAHHAFEHVASASIRKELHDNPAQAGLKRQVQEIEADTFAVYLALTYLFDGAGREPANAFFKDRRRSETEIDKMLLGLFVIAVGGFFYALPAMVVDHPNVLCSHHPPEDLRMNYVMHAATSWCNQNRLILETWVTPNRYRGYIKPVVEAIRGPAVGAAAATQTDFLLSAAGSEYRKQLEELRLHHFGVRKQGRPRAMEGD